METDLSYNSTDPVQGEDIAFSGLRRPDPYVNREEESNSPPPPPQNDYYYYNPPQPPAEIAQVKQQNPTDIFSSMDRTTYILLTIAFVFGFFMGRGMIQPVILRGSH